MKSLQLVQRLNARRLKDATDTYLQTLQAAPFEASEARTKSILTTFSRVPVPTCTWARHQPASKSKSLWHF